jgi:DNA polymerase-1
VDEDALITLLIDPMLPQELKDIINVFWDAAYARKQRSTFITSTLVLRAIGPDGRLRAGWNSCGTDTYRLSCSEPNLLNVPKELRGMYAAPPGMMMIGADWSQLELRVRGDVMHDRQLQADLKAGDVYSENAKDWFGLPAHMKRCKCEKECENPEGHIRNSARQGCKIIHLASQYNARPKTIHRQALKQKRDMKFELTHALHQAFLRRYADTVAFWQEEHKRVLEQGFSASRILDRRRNYPAPPPDTETPNYPIQTTASDVADLVWIDLDAKLKRYIPKAEIVMQQYDAFYLHVPKKKVEEAKEIILESMQQPFVIDGLQCVYPAELKVGERMSEV